MPRKRTQRKSSLSKQSKTFKTQIPETRKLKFCRERVNKGKVASKMSTRETSPVERTKNTGVSPVKVFNITKDFCSGHACGNPLSDFKAKTKEKLRLTRSGQKKNQFVEANFFEKLTEKTEEISTKKNIAKDRETKNKKGKKYGSKQGKKSEFSTKYKTEICKNFVTYGKCKFGDKCSFAHGKHELRTKMHINLHYKSKICKQFFENGFCPYGTRCQYLHNSQSYQQICKTYVEKLNVWIEKNPKLTIERILKKTHPL